MSVGIPIVASNTPPVAEVIDHEKSGLLVDFFDVDAQVEAINKILDNPLLADSLSDSSKKEASKTLVNFFGQLGIRPAPLRVQSRIPDKAAQSYWLRAVGQAINTMLSLFRSSAHAAPLVGAVVRSPHPPLIRWLTTTSLLGLTQLTTSLSATPQVMILSPCLETTPLPAQAALTSSTLGPATTF